MATVYKSGKFLETSFSQMLPYFAGFFAASAACFQANTSLLGRGLPATFEPEFLAESAAIGRIGVGGPAGGSGGQ